MLYKPIISTIKPPVFTKLHELQNVHCSIQWKSLMADRDNPEFLAFQRCNNILQGISHGLEPIVDRAFAQELIKNDLKNKCHAKLTAPEERTRKFLDVIRERIRFVPKTFHTFVKILKEDTGDYIGNMLIEKLEEVKKELKTARVQQASDNYGGMLIPTPPRLPTVVTYYNASERKIGLLASSLIDLDLSDRNISSFSKQAGVRSVTPPPTPSRDLPDLRTRVISRTPPPTQRTNSDGSESIQLPSFSQLPGTAAFQPVPLAFPTPQQAQNTVKRSKVPDQMPVVLQEKSKEPQSKSAQQSLMISLQAPSSVNSVTSNHEDDTNCSMSRSVSTDSAYFTPSGAIDQTDPLDCQSCANFKRSLSNSEEKIKSLEKKLEVCKVANNKQVSSLREELYTKDQECLQLKARCVDMEDCARRLEDTAVMLERKLKNQEIHTHSAQADVRQLKERIKTLQSRHVTCNQLLRCEGEWAGANPQGWDAQQQNAEKIAWQMQQQVPPTDSPQSWQPQQQYSHYSQHNPPSHQMPHQQEPHPPQGQQPYSFEYQQEQTYHQCLQPHPQPHPHQQPHTPPQPPHQQPPPLPQDQLPHPPEHILPYRSQYQQPHPQYLQSPHPPLHYPPPPQQPHPSPSLQQPHPLPPQQPPSQQPYPPSPQQPHPPPPQQPHPPPSQQPHPPPPQPPHPPPPQQPHFLPLKGPLPQQPYPQLQPLQQPRPLQQHLQPHHGYFPLPNKQPHHKQPHHKQPHCQQPHRPPTQQLYPPQQQPHPPPPQQPHPQYIGQSCCREPYEF